MLIYKKYYPHTVLVFNNKGFLTFLLYKNYSTYTAEKKIEVILTFTVFWSLIVLDLIDRLYIIEYTILFEYNS